MLFCFCLETPAESSLQASAHWLVEAEDGEQAIAKLLTGDLLKPWPAGSRWHLSQLREDCPDRQSTQDDGGPVRATQGRETQGTPVASGVLEV